MFPRRIVVTGATGFVGQHLLPVLQLNFPHAELISSAFDVTNIEAVRHGISATRPDALIHLAAVAAPRQAQQAPDLAWQVNLHGTLNVARAIVSFAPECTMLFVSSADAYGASFRSRQPLNENEALAPLGIYGATKAAADLALGAMVADGLRVVRARPFNHTGPGQSPAYVVPAFARQVARIEAGLQAPVLMVGALDAQRDFLDVRDVCSAYAAILASADRLASNTILNIASGRPQRIGDVLRTLMETAGVTAEIRTDVASFRPADIPVSCGDASLGHQLLNWTPVIPWERTLTEVLEDWRRRISQPLCEP